MTSAMLPHVRRALIANGVISDTGLTRNARYRRCRRGCGLILLAAIDDLGIDAWAWPNPTTTGGELTALLSGLTTWANPDARLLHRTSSKITHRPAHTERVYVQHRCTDPQPETNSATVIAKRNTADYSQPPPF